MHTRCCTTTTHNYNSPAFKARRAEYLSQILEPAYHTMNTSPTPSTSSLPIPSTSSKRPTRTKTYTDCQGIVHDPEWRYFPTEEWKKQRRARRTYYQQQEQQQRRRRSMEGGEQEEGEEEFAYRPTTTTTQGSWRRRRSFERDEDEDEEGCDDDWDGQEYAFGGKKNRTRYRSPVISSSSSTTTTIPALTTTDTRTSFDSIDSSPTIPTPTLGFVFTTDEKVPERKSSKLSISKIFRRHHQRQSKEQDEILVGSPSSFSSEYDFGHGYEDVVSSPTMMMAGLGLTGVDTTASSFTTTTTSTSASTSSPRVRFTDLPSPSSTRLSTTHSAPVSSPHPTTTTISHRSSSRTESTQMPTPAALSALSSHLTDLRSRAYKRYLALELSVTLGLVRTERRWRDWTAPSPSSSLSPTSAKQHRGRRARAGSF